MKKLLVLWLGLGIVADLLWGNVWHLLISSSGSGIWQILYLFRLPRMLNSLIAGSGLALAGLVLQTIFHNPLAGPYVLGISSGAALGVAIGLMVLGAGSMLSLIGQFVFAVVGAIAVILSLMILARHYSMVAVIIAGVLLAGIFSALISILQYFSPAQSVKNFVVWTMASVDMANYLLIGINLVIVLGGIIILSHKTLVLDSFYLGEDYAQSMGINVKAQRTFLVVSVGLIIAFLTAGYGPVAFVGVISPHIARWTISSQRHSSLLPYVIIIGAGVTVWADFFSHISFTVLPINAVLSLLGLPVLLLLILRREYDFF